MLRQRATDPLWPFLGFLLLAGAVVALEFAVDKSPTLSVAMAYLLEACCAVGFGVITWQVVMKN